MAKKPCPKAVSQTLPTGHVTHCFPGVAAGQGTGFNEILPEQALAWVRTVQQDVGAKVRSVAKQEYGNVFVPWWTKHRETQGVRMSQRSSLLGGALVQESRLWVTPQMCQFPAARAYRTLFFECCPRGPTCHSGSLPPIGETRRDEQLFWKRNWEGGQEMAKSAKCFLRAQISSPEPTWKRYWAW